MVALLDQQGGSVRGLLTKSGVNVNLIMPDGPASLEPLSGMSHMNGVIVEVERVATG